MREVEATNQSISANSPTHSRRCQKRYCARTAIGMYLGIIVATVENGKTVEQSGWEAASVASVLSSALAGVDAFPVEVEVDISRGDAAAQDWSGSPRARCARPTTG